MARARSRSADHPSIPRFSRGRRPLKSSRREKENSKCSAWKRGRLFQVRRRSSKEYPLRGFPVIFGLWRARFWDLPSKFAPRRRRFPPKEKNWLAPATMIIATRRSRKNPVRKRKTYRKNVIKYLFSSFTEEGMIDIHHAIIHRERRNVPYPLEKLPYTKYSKFLFSVENSLFPQGGVWKCGKNRG